MSSVTVFAVSILSFLIGGIPFGYLLGRLLLKDDIRNHGSGNTGATNVGRVIGWKWGALVLVLDALKGFLPTLAAMRYAQHQLAPSMLWNLPVVAGICAIVGHMYPVYLKLRGGKGVATALGVVLVLAPKAVALALAAFIGTVAVTKIVAVSSMTAAVVFGSAQLYLMGDQRFQSASLSLTLFSIAVPLLIVWRHRSNITRLLSGRKPVASESAADNPVDCNPQASPDEQLPDDRP